MMQQPFIMKINQSIINSFGNSESFSRKFVELLLEAPGELLPESQGTFPASSKNFLWNFGDLFVEIQRTSLETGLGNFSQKFGELLPEIRRTSPRSSKGVSQMCWGFLPEVWRISPGSFDNWFRRFGKFLPEAWETYSGSSKNFLRKLGEFFPEAWKFAIELLQEVRRAWLEG